MNKPLFVKNSILIDASKAEVWDALVNPEKTKQYMFGCEAVSDWGKGDPLLWKGQLEGKEVVYVKGEILEILPEHKLVYTTIDPHSNIDDKSENYLQVTYILEEDGEKTKLSVTQGDYATVADGDRRYHDSYNGGEGWSPILKEIKRLVEAE